MKTITGKTIKMEVYSESLVLVVKERLMDKEFLQNSKHLKIVHKGKILEEEKTLRHYNVSKEDTLYLSLMLPSNCGCSIGLPKRILGKEFSKAGQKKRANKEKMELKSSGGRGKFFGDQDYLGVLKLGEHTLRRT